METVPITAVTPMLEGVLGPLTDEQDTNVRGALVQLGATLASAAEAISGRVGWHGVGVELHWLPSGQQSLWCSVEAADSEAHAVAFIAELRPSWYYGERSGRAGWIVEVSVEVDCRHYPDHGSMHEVHSQSEAAATVDEAIDAFGRGIQALDLLASDPVEQWTAKGAHG